MTRSILVLRAGALGDAVLTFPAVQALRSRFPGAALRVVGYPDVWEVAGPLIDRVDPIDSPPFAGLFSSSPSPRLQAWLHGVDLAVAWTVRDPTPALQVSGVPEVIHASPHPPPGLHASQWLLATISTPSVAQSVSLSAPPVAQGFGPSWPRDSGGTSPRPASPEDLSALPDSPPNVPPIQLALSEEERTRARGDLHQLGIARPTFLHPGAGAPWKRWPAERFARLATELLRRGHQPVLIEGPADRDVVAQVQEQADGPFPVVRHRSARQLAAVLSQGERFIGNDSGVTHLAAAAGVPTIALFGPTDPANWRPLGNASVLRNCGARTQRQGQIRVCDDATCMEGMAVDEVLQSLEQVTLCRP